MIAKHYNKLSDNQLKNSLVLLSIIIACWVMYIQKGWINDDSLLYFESARLFSIGEWSAGVQLFPWPLYSLLIAGLHYITGLQFQLCAQILTAVFFALTTHSLLHIVMLAGGNKFNLLATALLLISSSYIAGAVLPMLIRDQGFWAFLLTALVFFVKFYRDQKIKDALYWQLFALIAFLFRVEAAIYIALLPVSLLNIPKIKISEKIQLILKAHSLNLLLTLAASSLVVLHSSLTLDDLGRLKEIFVGLSQIQENITHTISTKVHIMATDVLGEQLQDFAWLSFILSLTIIAALKCLLVAGWLPLLLNSLFYKNIKNNMAEDARHILFVVALLGFMNALLIILKVNILVGRYVIIFGFVMLVFASFAIQKHPKEWHLKQTGVIKKSIFVVAIISISLGIISNYWPKTNSYTYEQDAVSYVKSLQESKDGKIFYSSYKARHYAGESYIGRWENFWTYTQQAINNKSIDQYSYLVINFTADDNTAEIEKVIQEKLPQYSLIKKFYGYKGKKGILIYIKQAL